MRGDVLKSYQNLVLLQNLYRLKAMGYEYIDPFSVNEKTVFETPASLAELQENIKRCHLCDLSKSRTQSLAGFGRENASLMIVDYQVSSTQDSSNTYYAGRSGNTLKNMIEKVLNLSVNDVYLTHNVKCKPLGTNQPSPSECNSCKPYLQAQIEFIQPKVIVTLGEDAYVELTDDKDNFENVRGHVIDFKSYKLIPIYHPQHMLRNPDLKRVTMNDLKTIKSCI
jgi:DNA polymerase